MSVSLPPICILAGGLGERLGAAVRYTPKPLLEVAGEPFLLHQLRLLADHGAGEVVVCVGYLGEKIVQRIGDERFGIRIAYSHDGPRPLGTLGAVRVAAPKLGSRFLVLYGDTYLRLDYAAAFTEWERSGLPAMMTVLRNDRRWDVSNACFDGRRVTAYNKRAPTPAMRWIDYGLGGLQRQTLELVGEEVSDLADLYHELAGRNALFGFEATNRFYEIGTPEALEETSAFLASRK
ncbi:MAG: NTP transferase domain-containing protein [Solirubrobacterales bacterium]|nr:NTP transferase domain-containing protein [Solirubrobacterales bacterium]